MSAPRYDFTAAMRYIAINWPHVGTEGSERRPASAWGAQDVTSTLGSPLHEFLHVERQTSERWKARGWLTTEQADRVATALRTHPSWIWPSWYDDVVDEPTCSVCGDVAPWSAGLDYGDEVVARYCGEKCRAIARKEKDRLQSLKRRDLKRQLRRAS